MAVRVCPYFSVMERKLVARLQSDELTISEVEVRPLHCEKLHCHENPRIILIIEGLIADSSPPIGKLCGPKSLLYRPAGAIHQDVYLGRGGRYVAIDIGVWRQPPFCLDTNPIDGGAFEPSDALDQAETGILAALRARSPNQALTAVESALHAMRREQITRRSGPEWLVRAEQYMLRNRHQPVRVAEIAAHAGVHPMHLVKVYRRMRGGTIRRWIEQARIDDAVNELLHSDDSVGSAAARLGFSDQSHFSRVFRHRAGVTPGSFRTLSRLP